DIKIPTIGARVMSLQEPTKKMSKSDENARSFVSMLDTPKQMEKKIKSAITDSDGVVAFDEENKPGVSNLLSIYCACTGATIEEAVSSFESKGYGDFKGAVAEAVTSTLIPIQERYEELIKSTELDDILTQGTEKAAHMANKTLENAKKKMGL